MKLAGIISTAVLSLTLGATAPAFAQQEQHDQQQEQKDKPAEKKAQSEKPVKQDGKNAQQQEQKNAQQSGKQAQRSGGNGGGRIPADRFQANFGREHTFRVSQGDYSNHHFRYGGYSFGFVDPWPSNWLYTQNVFVVEIDGVYYLCNASYPGVNIALSVTL